MKRQIAILALLFDSLRKVSIAENTYKHVPSNFVNRVFCFQNNKGMAHCLCANRLKRKQTIDILKMKLQSFETPSTSTNT